MHATILNASLKPSSAEAPSSTAALGAYLAGRLGEHGVTVDEIRLADHRIDPGVVSEAVSDGDEWPALRERVLAADLLLVGTPTWLGQPSSLAKRALERMDALISETTDDGTPVLYNTVAGVFVVGNEDGAHHCISEIAGPLLDLGCTIPGQAWTYWNKGPGPGDEEYVSTDEKEWTHSTGDAMVHVLVHVAEALAEHPIPSPPNT